MSLRHRLIVVFIGLGLVLSACEQDVRTIKLGRSIEEPAPSIADAVKEMLSEHRFDVQIEKSSDPNIAMQAVLDGHLDLAIIEEPDRPLPDLMTLSPLYPSVLHILHRRGAPVSNLESLLDGAGVYAGPAGGAASKLLEDLVSDFDISRDSFHLLDNPWTQSPDVYFILGGLLPRDSVAGLAGYELFSLATEGDVAGGSIADGIALRHHHLQPFLLPKGLYVGLADKPILTLSTRTILIAHEDFDEQLAFEIASALFTNAQEISSQYPLVTQELNEDMQGSTLMLPLHAGTRRYQDRDRPGFVERNVDLIALYLTIALAVVSGSVAYYRNRQQVKKDRIDVFYERLLSIRSNMSDNASSSKDLRQKVLAVQSEVFELLINERIAADESLVVFVSFSNQMLVELGEIS